MVLYVSLKEKIVLDINVLYFRHQSANVLFIEKRLQIRSKKSATIFPKLK